MTSTMIIVFERSYKIDKDALQEYGRTTQAGGVSPIIQGNENKLTNGAVLAKFLETVDGDGVCRVEYRHSKKYDEVGLDECGLIHSRVYPCRTLHVCLCLSAAQPARPRSSQ